ncbi:hypothetical protein K1719_023229 [Acacia pycnantha]|nr:hypothetical protein K1719_023229 [Acacia pycnantha]
MSHRVNDEVVERVIEETRRSVHSSRRHDGTIHKVGAPPKQNLLKEIKESVMETFFADKPLDHFKDQPASRKFVLGIQAVFPILDWGRSYNLSKFKGDLVAGLTIASLCIPQDIAYAKLANLLPQYGLYASFVAPLVYAFMGSSRDIAIGPVAVVSLLLGTMLTDEISNYNSHDYLRLAFTATFFAGVTQMALAVLRLGFLIDFLSHAAIVGFMAGAAITIALQQFKGLLGIKHFTTKTDIISVMRSVWSNVHHGWNWQTIVIGLAFLAFLLATKYLAKKNKKFFWVCCNCVTHRKGTGLIALTEAVAIGRTFAAAKDYPLDGNKEMVAMGTMNIIGSLTSAYVATGSFSRSAVNYMAGCQTAVSNIIMSIVVLLTLVFITPLFKYAPNAVLASIIIAAVMGLINIDAVILLWKIDKFDFVACMGAFFGVIFKSVEIGLLVAVAISFAKILLQVTRPRTVVLGKLPGTKVVDSAIYFSNSNYIKDRILRWLQEEDEQRKESSFLTVEYLIVEMSPVTDIDTSGIHAFEDLHRSLQKRGVQLLLANPGTIVMEKLYASKLVEVIGEDRIFLSVGDAVATIGSKVEEV